MACSKLLKDGVRGEGLAKARESLELLRLSVGVCGLRLGVEVQLEVRECSGGSLVGTATSLLSLSSDIWDKQSVRNLQYCRQSTTDLSACAISTVHYGGASFDRMGGGCPSRRAWMRHGEEAGGSRRA